MVGQDAELRDKTYPIEQLAIHPNINRNHKPWFGINCQNARKNITLRKGSIICIALIQTTKHYTQTHTKPAYKQTLTSLETSEVNSHINSMKESENIHKISFDTLNDYIKTLSTSNETDIANLPEVFTLDNSDDDELCNSSITDLRGNIKMY